MHLTNALRRARRLRGNDIALVDGERRFTWNEFVDRIARQAGLFHSLGMKRGDRIAILANNNSTFIETYFGPVWAGGMISSLNTRHSVSEITACLNDSGAKILLIGNSHVSMLPEIRQGARDLRHVLLIDEEGPLPEGTQSYEEMMASAEPVEDAMCGGDDVACLYYTGGTTGQPKAVMLTHNNLWFNALGTSGDIGMREDSTALVSGPLFHLGSGSRVYSGVIAGATLVVLPQFSLPEVLDTIDREQVTHATVVPTMLNSIVNWPGIEKYDFRSLRLVSYGASAIPESLLLKTLEVFPNSRMLQTYGMTETSPAVSILRHEDHLPPPGKEGRRRSAGRPITTAEVRIVDAEDRELPTGTVGEVVVRGPMVMKGYWNQPELTAETLRGGWMHTGDAGYMDEDGYLYIADRIKDMIISGGENVYSAEVENALYKHPDIAECAVVGIPHEKWGEAVHAVIVLKDGASLTAEDVIAHCRTLIAGYKCPKSVEFSAEPLPKSGPGKILKKAVRERFWQDQSRRIN